MNLRDYNYCKAHKVILEKEVIIDIDFIMIIENHKNLKMYDELNKINSFL